MSQNKRPGDADAGELSVERTVNALADDHRRAVLAYLFDREGDGPVSAEDLTDHVDEVVD